MLCCRDRSPRDRKNWDYKDKIRDKDVRVVETHCIHHGNVMASAGRGLQRWRRRRRR